MSPEDRGRRGFQTSDGKTKACACRGDTQVTAAGPRTRARSGRTPTKGLVCQASTCGCCLTGCGSPWRIPSAGVTAERCTGKMALQQRRGGRRRFAPWRGVSVQRCSRGKAAGGGQGRAWGWGLEGRADEGDLVRPRGCWKEGGEGGSSGTFRDERRRHYTKFVSLLPGTKGFHRA